MLPGPGDYERFPITDPRDPRCNDEDDEVAALDDALCDIGRALFAANKAFLLHDFEGTREQLQRIRELCDEVPE